MICTTIISVMLWCVQFQQKRARSPSLLRVLHLMKQLRPCSWRAYFCSLWCGVSVQHVMQLGVQLLTTSSGEAICTKTRSNRCSCQLPIAQKC